MEKLGVGIVGCGWVAGEYVKAFHTDQRSEIRALVSRNRANAERYRDAFWLAVRDRDGSGADARQEGHRHRGRVYAARCAHPIRRGRRRGGETRHRREASCFDHR